MQSEDEVNSSIDRALATYSNVEPLSGLESRVLNRICDARANGRSRYGAGVLCAAAAVLGILVVMPPFGHHRQESHGPSSQRPAVVSSHEAGAFVPAAAKQLHVNAGNAQRTKRHRPTRTQLATTMPLSPDEQALLTLTRTKPELAGALATRQTEPENPDIVIEPIRITPLPEIVLE